MGWLGPLEKALMPLLLLSQTFPKVAIAPLFVIWLGFGLWPKVVVSFLISFFPIVISMAGGGEGGGRARGAPPPPMSAGRGQEFLKTRPPGAPPRLFDGLKVSVALAIVGAV